MLRHHLLVAASLIIAVQAGAVGSTAYLDEADGFRDVRFGTPVDSYTGLSDAEPLGQGKVCYSRPSDDLTVGDARLQSIRYCFRGRRLWAVVFDAVGPNNSQALYRFFEETYGPGQPGVDPNGGIPTRFDWRGRQVRGRFQTTAGGISAQARLWRDVAEDSGSHSPKGATHPGHPWHGDHDPRPPVLQGKASIALNVPHHATPGMVVQISLRYRNVTAPARVRIAVPPALRIQQTVPDTHVSSDGVALWIDLPNANGSVKIKAQIHPEAPTGQAVLVYAEVGDATGGAEQTRDAIVIR